MNETLNAWNITPPEMDPHEDLWSGVSEGFGCLKKNMSCFFYGKTKAQLEIFLGLDLGVFCPIFFGGWGLEKTLRF